LDLDCHALPIFFGRARKDIKFGGLPPTLQPLPHSLPKYLVFGEGRGGAFLYISYLPCTPFVGILPRNLVKSFPHSQTESPLTRKLRLLPPLRMANIRTTALMVQED
jgi:hypothetical protein